MGAFGRILGFVQDIMQAGPRRLGDRVAETVPGMVRVRNSLNGALNGAPVIGSLTGAAAGSVALGLVTMYAAYYVVTNMVM